MSFDLEKLSLGQRTKLAKLRMLVMKHRRIQEEDWQTWQEERKVYDQHWAAFRDYARELGFCANCEKQLKDCECRTAATPETHFPCIMQPVLPEENVSDTGGAYAYVDLDNPESVAAWNALQSQQRVGWPINPTGWDLADHPALSGRYTYVDESSPFTKEQWERLKATQGKSDLANMPELAECPPLERRRMLEGEWKLPLFPTQKFIEDVVAVLINERDNGYKGCSRENHQAHVHELNQLIDGMHSIPIPAEKS